MNKLIRNYRTYCERRAEQARKAAVVRATIRLLYQEAEGRITAEEFQRRHEAIVQGKEIKLF